MIVEELEPFTVSRDCSVEDAMAAINENANGIVLVVDDAETLLGTVTDGDIRRAILDGTPLSENVCEVMNDDPFWAKAGMSSSTLRRISHERGLRQIPVVDEDDSLVKLYLRDGRPVPSASAESEETLAGEAVVMAGGLGTRLRPLTEDTPKPMVEVGGKPILEHIVEHLSCHGVEKIYLTTRYLAGQIEDYFQDGDAWGVEIEYVREEKRLGTAGGLSQLESRLTGPTLVMNGDLVTDFQVGEMFRFHREHRPTITMGVRHYEMKVPYGVAEVEGVGVEALNEKPEFEFFVNAGIYVIDPDVIDYIPEDDYYDITSLVEDVLESGDVTAFPIVQQWLDIGRPEDLERANRELDLESTD